MARWPQFLVQGEEAVLPPQLPAAATTPSASEAEQVAFLPAFVVSTP